MTTLFLIITLCFIDITLTHYRFFLDKKKEVFNVKDELGTLARLIMKGNPAPNNYIVGCLISFLVLIFASFFTLKFVDFMFGAYFIIIWTHLAHISIVHQNWYNKKFWHILKKYRQADKSK